MRADSGRLGLQDLGQLNEEPCLASGAAAVAGVSVQTVSNDHKNHPDEFPGEVRGGRLYVFPLAYKAWRESRGITPRFGGGRPKGSTASPPAVIMDDDGNPLSMNDIRLRQESVRLEQENLELEKAKGNLVEREDIEFAWGQLLQEVRTTLETLPQMVAAESSKAGLSERQAGAVREACEERVGVVIGMMEKGE